MRRTITFACENPNKYGCSLIIFKFRSQSDVLLNSLYKSFSPLYTKLASYLTSVSLIKRSMTNVNGNGSKKNIAEPKRAIVHHPDAFPVSPIPALDICYYYAHMWSDQRCKFSAYAHSKADSVFLCNYINCNICSAFNMRRQNVYSRDE